MYHFQQFMGCVVPLLLNNYVHSFEPSPFLLFSQYFLHRIKYFMVTIHLVAGWLGSRLKTLYISIFWNVSVENKWELYFLKVAGRCFALFICSRSSVYMSWPCAAAVPGHGLWMFQYGDKRPVFDVLSPEGTDLSPIMSAIYLFLTMIIVFQVPATTERPKETKGADKDINTVSLSLNTSIIPLWVCDL